MWPGGTWDLLKQHRAINSKQSFYDERPEHEGVKRLKRHAIITLTLAGVLLGWVSCHLETYD